jgi:hypothetical protein
MGSFLYLNGANFSIEFLPTLAFRAEVCIRNDSFHSLARRKKGHKNETNCRTFQIVHSYVHMYVQEPKTVPIQTFRVVSPSRR